MNNIGLTLTADNKAMIKALQDAEKAMASMGRDMNDALKQVQAQANQTGQAMAGMANPSTLRGMTQLHKQVGELGMSAKATSAALRQVPAQFTDIVVSLQGGQAPLTVLLQQGGQLKDVFGGIGPAARALGGYVLGLINPFTLAAAAAAVLGLAYKQGSDEADAFRKSLLLTGNAAGTTIDQLAGMADSMDETFGVTTGKAADALNAMAGTGRIARTSLQDFAQVAIDVEKSFGQSIEDTAKNFAELGKDPVGASKRLNESLNFLTAATYAQIKAAMDLGETEKAAAIAQDAYAKAMKGRADTVVQNLGYIERAYRASLSWAKEAWDAILGIGRADTTAEKMKDVRKELDLIDQGLRNVSPRQRAALEQQLAALQETEKMAKLAGDKQAERVATEKAGIAAIDQTEKDREKNRRAAEDAAKKAAKEAADARKAELDVGELRNKLAEENAKREAKNLVDMAKLHEASVKPFEQSLKAQEKRVKSLEQEEAAIALSEKMNVSLAQAVEMVNIAKLKEQQIDAMGNEEAVAAIQKEIEEREKLVKLIGNKEARDASAKAAKQAADDWKKASDKIQDSITDALMRGFESGKGFGRNLVDTIKNMFSTLVLRPIIQAVVGGVTGLGGTAASASGSSGLLGGGSGALGELDTIKNVYSTITGGFAALGDKVAFAAQDIGAWLVQNTTGALNSAGGSLMSSAGTLGTIGSYAGGALAGVVIGNAISGQFSAFGNKNTATVVGTAIGALFGGPLGAAIGGAIGGVVNRAFGMGAKSVTGEGISGTFGASGADVRLFQSWFQKGGWFRSDKSGVNRSPISTEMDQFLDSALGSIATSVKSYSDVLGLNTDKINGFTKSININFQGLDAAGREKAIANEIASFGDDMARQILTTTKQVTYKRKFFGRQFDYVVNQVIAPEKWMREGETATAALTRMSTSLAAVNGALGLMNQTLLASSLAGGEAASKLVDLFGGIEGFGRATDAYYQAFYSESERSTKMLSEIGKAIGSAGLAVPTTIAGFRQLVEAQDLNTDAGRTNYAMLLQLAPAFAQATNAMASLGGSVNDAAAAAEAAAQAERERAEAVSQERIGLQDRLDQLTMASAQLLEKERNALDASNRALFDQIQAVEAQKAATEAATQAERERADAMVAAGRTVQEEIRRLRGLSGNTTNQAALQAQFATLTGMARAGDADALAKLPAISQAIEEASRLTAVSALDVARMRTWLSGSLSDTIAALGLNVPAFADGGMHAGGIRLVGENGPELEVTGASRIYNAQQTAAMLQGGGDAASEIRAMREELSMLRAEARATAINTGRQADLMKRVTRNGEAMTVQTDLTPLEVTTA